MCLFGECRSNSVRRSVWTSYYEEIRRWSCLDETATKKLLRRSCYDETVTVKLLWWSYQGATSNYEAFRSISMHLRICFFRIWSSRQRSTSDDVRLRSSFDINFPLRSSVTAGEFRFLTVIFNLVLVIFFFSIPIDVHYHVTFLYSVESTLYIHLLSHVALLRPF